MTKRWSSFMATSNPMNRRPDFAETLRRIQAELCVRQLPVDVDRRLRATLDERRQTDRRWFAWPALACAAAAAALFAVVVTDGGPGVEVGPEPRSIAGLRITVGHGQVRVEPSGIVTVSAGGATLVDDEQAVSLDTQGRCRLARISGGFRVFEGRVIIDVMPGHHRGSGPFRIVVSHGEIHVLGTRFTVVQRTGSGEVALERGRIEFVASDGRRVALTPDERLAWPLPAADIAAGVEPTPLLEPDVSPHRSHEEPDREPAPTIEPPPRADPKTTVPPKRRQPTSRGRPKRRPKTPDKPPPTPPANETEREPVEPRAEAPARCDLGAVLKRISGLRSRGRPGQAIEEIKAALKLSCGKGARRRLSFELGSMLSNQHGNTERACTYWKRHQARFGLGAYATEIRSARARLGCRSSEPSASED